MKERLKKFFSKQNLFVFICLSLIIAFCVLYVILNNNDKKNMSQFEHDSCNKNISWVVGNDGSLTSENLWSHDDVVVEANSSLNLSVTLISGWQSVYFSFDVDRIGNWDVTVYDDSDFDIISINGDDIYSYSAKDRISSSGGNILVFQFTNSGYTLNFMNIMLSYRDLPFEPYNTIYYTSNSYANLEYDYDNLQSDFEELQRQYESLSSDYSDLNSTYNSYVSSHSYTNTQYNDLNTNYTNLQSTYNTLVASNQQLQSDYSSLQNTYNSYVSSHSYTNTQYNDLNALYTQLQSDYSSLQSTYNTLNTNYNSLNALYTQLQSDYSDLEYEYDNLQSDFEELQRQYESLSSDYSDLNSTYNDYVDSHSYTNTQYNTLNTNYTNLQSTYNTLVASNQQLQNTYNSYVDSHSYTNIQYNDLNALYTQLQSDYSSLQSTYNTLNTNYNSLNALYTQLQIDYSDLEYENDNLQSDFEELQRQYESLSSDYSDLQNEFNDAYNIGYNDALQLVYKDNAFYNATLNYYMNMTIDTAAYSIVITNDYLNGNQFIQPINIFWSIYSDEEMRAYVENTNLSYFELIFDSSVPFSLLNFKYLCVLGNDFDYNVSFYCDDNYVWSYHNPQYVHDNNDNPPYNEFFVDFNGSNLENRSIYKMTWRRQYSYQIGTISDDKYAIGYSDGVNDTTIRLNEDIKSLEDEKKDLQFEIRSLQESLENSLNTLAYSFISSVMSTPFNILHDYLNWNFFGINLFSLFTSLITLLLVIWVIKFLLGRK